MCVHVLRRVRESRGRGAGQRNKTQSGRKKSILEISLHNNIRTPPRLVGKKANFFFPSNMGSFE